VTRESVAKAYGGKLKALLTVEKSAISYLRLPVQSKKIYQVNAVFLQEKESILQEQ